MIVHTDHPISVRQIAAYSTQRLPRYPRRATPVAVLLGSGLIGVAIRPHRSGISVVGTYPTLWGILAFFATFGLLHILCQPYQNQLEREVVDQIRRDLGKRGK